MEDHLDDVFRRIVNDITENIKNYPKEGETKNRNHQLFPIHDIE